MQEVPWVYNQRLGHTMAYRFGPFSFDASEGLTRDGVEVQLPPRAIGVLAALLERAGTVVSKQILMDATWRDTFVTEASLLEAVRLLREALGDDRQSPTYIQTVHRRGYRFIAAVDVVSGEAPFDFAQGRKASPLRTKTKEPILDRAEWRPLLVSGLAWFAELTRLVG